MLRAGAILAATLLPLAGAAAAEPIVGTWRTPEGGLVEIAACGGGYCMTVTSQGPHKGKRIGELAGSGGAYAGTVTDPTNDRTYQGSATVKGGMLSLTGCALKIFCRSQTWTRS